MGELLAEIKKFCDRSREDNFDYFGCFVVSSKLWSYEDQSFSIQESATLEQSYAGHFGKAIEPSISPIGFDWKIGIALITSFAAREVFVGTMSTIYSVGDEENFDQLREKMKKDRHKSGEPVYSLAVILSLMVFYAFAMQCMSTLAIVKKETNSWRWPLIQLVGMTFIAYISSLVFYQLMS